jgi:hypothetical protein
MDAVSEELQGLLDTDADDVPALAYMEEGIFESDAEDCERAITGSVRFISSLSCVDGLILATPELAIKGFGWRFGRRKNQRQSSSRQLRSHTNGPSAESTPAIMARVTDQ